MSIGAGIVLFVIGAVLAFAINGSAVASFVSLSIIGYILMAAGVLVFTLGMVFTFRRRRSVATTTAAVDPNTGDRVIQHEQSNDSPLV